MRKITKIIVHCTATPEGKDIKTETIRDWHVNGNHWEDIVSSADSRGFLVWA